jgi:lysophospholipid acyltransferase (LPLAT)-like uncharacterized protein
MKTWDGFIIPLPFSKVSVMVEDQIRIPENLTPEEFEARRREIEQRLKNAAD